MPEYSYWAAAYGHLASYLVMFAVSAVLGAKYYPIPYRWGRLIGIFVIMGAVYGLSLLLDSKLFAGVTLSASPWQLAAKLGVHTALILCYMLGAWKLIRK